MYTFFSTFTETMKYSFYFLLNSLFFITFLSCSKQERVYKTIKINEMSSIVDSLSAPAITYIKRQGKEDLEKRLIIELPYKIDSVLKIKKSLLYVDTTQK
jgi:hypothetical protein